MNFFRRSFTAKVLSLLIGVAVLAALVLFYLERSYGLKFLPISFVLYAIVALVLVLGFVFWWSVTRPLKEITMQMEALVTGHEYKKFFTDRVDEVGVMAHFFNEITKNLNRFTGDLQEGKRMASELEIASHIQEHILPKQSPSIPGLSVASKSIPAAEVGGDSFDFLETPSASYLYIGDATGHGVPAGIVMTIVNTLVYVYSEISSSLLDLIVNVNRHLKARIEKTLFMSMVMLKWDKNQQMMTFVGAGHEYILLYRMKTGECEVISVGGIALGMVPDNSKIIKEQMLSFEQGDMLFLYTDGIVECRDMSGELFGIERFKQAIAKYASQYAPEPTLQKIIADLDAFRGAGKQDDDMTVIAIQRVSG